MASPKLLQKQQAKHLYFRTSKTIKAIAETVGVTPKALFSWIKKERWAEQKEQAFYSPEQILTKLYEQLREINNNIAQREEGKRFGTKEELDAQAKIISAITAITKNSAEAWRNIAPEFEVSTEETLKKPEKLNVKFRHSGKIVGEIKAGDIPLGGVQPNGLYAADENTMHEYYCRIANLFITADVPFPADFDPNQNRKRGNHGGITS